MLGVGIWHGWLTVLFQELSRSSSLREMVGFCLQPDGMKSGSHVLLDARTYRKMFHPAWL